MIGCEFMCEEIQERKKIVLPFLITTLNGMAYGLFATLIVGTIIGTISTLFQKVTMMFASLLRKS